MTESLQTEEDATPLQFGEDADRLHLEDPEARSAFNEALMEFCREVDWSPGVIAYI